MAPVTKEGFILGVATPAQVEAAYPESNGEGFVASVKFDPTDITNYIYDFDFEESTEKDDKLELRLAGLTVAFFDQICILEGIDVEFIWGYIQGQQRKFTLPIADIEPEFSDDKIGCVIRCLDKGQLMKKGDRSVDWKEKTSTDIVSVIAQRNGMTLVADTSTNVWATMPQFNQTDWDFVKDLAEKEDFIFFIKGNELHFERRNLSQKPSKAYTLGIDPIVRFIPKHKGHKQSAGALQTNVPGVNMDKKTPHDGSNTPYRQGGTLGEVSWNWDADGKRLNNTGGGRNIVTGVDSDAESINIALSAQGNAQLDNLEATLVTPGDLDAFSNKVITMSGYGGKYSGNYYIETVKHKIVASTYTTTQTLSKDASRTGISTAGVAQPKPNTEKGGNGKQQIPLRFYDQNGQEIIFGKDQR